MRIKNSLDWQQVSMSLSAQLHSAPAHTKKDLSKMLNTINELVHDLARQEVELRRTHKESNPEQQRLLAQIETAIDQFEQWATMAHLLG
jgi:hypothetical protein